MKRHHEIEFATFMDTLYTDGAVSLRWDHLYRWFGATRISKGTWQKIFDAWEDLSKEMLPDHVVPKIWCLKLDNSLTLIRSAYEKEDCPVLTASGESSDTSGPK